MALLQKADVMIPPRNPHFDEAIIAANKKRRRSARPDRLGTIAQKVYDRERAVLAGHAEDRPTELTKKIESEVAKGVKKSRKEAKKDLVQAEQELLEILSDEYSDGGSDSDDRAEDEEDEEEDAVDNDDSDAEEDDDDNDEEEEEEEEEDQDDDDDDDDVNDIGFRVKVPKRKKKGNAKKGSQRKPSSADGNFADDKRKRKGATANDSSSSGIDSDESSSDVESDTMSSSDSDLEPEIISRKSIARPSKVMMDKWSGTMWSEKEKKRRYYKRKQELKGMFSVTTGNDPLMRYAKRHGILGGDNDADANGKGGDKNKGNKMSNKNRDTAYLFKTKNGRRTSRGSVATKYISSILGPNVARRLCSGERGKNEIHSASGGGVTSAVPIVNREFMDYVTRPTHVVDMNNTVPLTPRELAARPRGIYTAQLPVRGKGTGLTSEPIDVHNQKNAGIYVGHDIDYKATHGLIPRYSHAIPMFSDHGTKRRMPSSMMPIFEAEQRHVTGSTPLMDMIMEREIENQTRSLPPPGTTVIPGTYDGNYSTPTVFDVRNKTRGSRHESRDAFYRYGTLHGMRAGLPDY